jgi:hypothetical protein
MADLRFVDAFAQFGAKPANAMWAVSAFAADGALVISCWAHYFRPGADGALEYCDRLSRWGGNAPGNNLLRDHLVTAFSEQRPVRMVVATTSETETVDAGRDASKLKKTFHVRKDLVGVVTTFDGDNFVITFRRAT